MKNNLNLAQVEELLDARIKAGRVFDVIRKGFARFNVDEAFQFGFWCATNLSQNIYEKSEEWSEEYRRALQSSFEFFAEKGIIVDGVLWDRVEISRDIEFLMGGERCYCSGVTAERLGLNCYADNYLESGEGFLGPIVILLSNEIALKFYARWNGDDWKQMKTVLNKI